MIAARSKLNAPHGPAACAARWEAKRKEHAMKKFVKYFAIWKIARRFLRRA